MEQLIRYGVVGVATNIFAYLIYLFLSSYYLDPKHAMTVVYISGATLGYIGNRNWTFLSNKHHMIITFVRYIFSQFVGLVANYLMLIFFVDRLHYPHQIVQAFAIITIAIFLFVSCKYFVFREAR